VAESHGVEDAPISPSDVKALAMLRDGRSIATTAELERLSRLGYVARDEDEDAWSLTAEGRRQLAIRSRESGVVFLAAHWRRRARTLRGLAAEMSPERAKCAAAIAQRWSEMARLLEALERSEREAEFLV
jgi:hypothetical protein